MITFITIVLVQNILLFHFFGTDLIFDKRMKTASSTMVLIASFFVVFIISILNWVGYNYFLKPYHIEYMTVFVFAINLIISALLVDFVFKKFINFLHETFQELIFVISYSTLIFGVSLVTIEISKTLSSYILTNVLNVLGFVLVYYLIFTIREKIEYNKFPKYVYPVPILFVLLGILSMAFKGLANAFYNF
ncbi:MAG: Rnf-Nqr domain containing protein [Alphaproteobacteria bacterium]